MDDEFDLNKLSLEDFELILSVIASEDNSPQAELYMHYAVLKFELF